MDEVLGRAAPLAMIVVRVLVVYAFGLLLLRLVGRRTMSQLRPIDLLAMLLLSETVSPALTGGDDSIVGGLVAASTLAAASAAVAYLSFRFRWFDRALDGDAVVLIDRGRLNEKVLRRMRITDGDLRTSLHENGVASVAEVKKAFVEPDGEIRILEA